MKYLMKALPVSILVAPMTSMAHTGDAVAHGSPSFFTGVIHALTGLDHMVGAIMAGVCIALAMHKGSKSLLTALPILFVAAVSFLVSAIVGSLLPSSLASMAEWAVLASLVVMMIAIATGLKQGGQPLALAGVLIVALASCHALAHGAEMSSVSLIAVTAFATGACSLLAMVASLVAYASKQVLSRFHFAKV